MEHRTNSSTQVTPNKDDIRASPILKDLSDHYELDGSVDENYSKPGENVGDEYDYADKKEFWEPASQEKELKIQVERLTEVQVINNDALW